MKKTDSFSVLTLRLDEKETGLVESLKKKTSISSASKALVQAADIVCNEMPFIVIRRDEYKANAENWKQKYLALAKLIKINLDCEKKINEIIKKDI